MFCVLVEQLILVQLVQVSNVITSSDVLEDWVSVLIQVGV